MKKTIIFITALFLALATFEFFLKYSPFEYGTSPGVYDEEIGVWHKKNFSGYSISECYKTKYFYDDKGLPKSTKTYDKNKDDIVFLGDSFVEAVMIENPYIIHNAFAKDLNYKYNGLSGTSVMQSFMILKKKVDLAKTKYVIEFVSLDGDLLEMDYKQHNTMSRPKVYLDVKSLKNYKVIPPRAITLRDKVGDFLGDYQIYFFIKKLIYSLQEKTATPLTKKAITEKAIPKFTKDWLTLQASIYQTSLLAKENNINFLLIISTEDKKKKERLKTFLQKENIPFISIQEEAEKRGITLQTFSCDGHWTKEAHHDISKIIFESGFINTK